MGCFDTVRCQAKVPGAELLGDREFQTKDLGKRMDEFTIRGDGRLIHHRTRWGSDPSQWTRFPDRDVLVPLHDDVTLTGHSADGLISTYVARFTDGKLEWIKPKDSLSEDHQEYLWSGD